MAKSEFDFLHDIRVRYSEIDGQGIVFNAHYLTYFDIAITEFFRNLGFDYKEYVERTDMDFHLVKSLVNYEKPIPFDMEMQVGCRVEKMGNTSLTFRLEIFEKGKDDRFCNGEIVWVHTDQKSHGTIRISDEIRGILS